MLLIHRETQRQVDADIVPVTKADLKVLKEEMRFEFDWESEILTRQTIYALVLQIEGKTVGLLALKDMPEELRLEIVLLECSKENIGKSKEYEHIAGCLIAYACQIAFSKGYLGFVSLTPKTSLINHYMNTYGFCQYGRQLATDLENSEALIKKYLV